MMTTRLTLDLDALSVDSFVVPATAAAAREPTTTCTLSGFCCRPTTL